MRSQMVGSSTGAAARRLLLGLYPRFPSSCPFRSCRSPVSSATSHVACGFPALRAPTLHITVYETYQTGATAEFDGRYDTRYSEKSPKVPYSHSLLHRFQPKPRR
jgi:hypothetical protein